MAEHEQLKMQPDYVLGELDFAYGIGALNSLDTQIDYFNHAEVNFGRLKAANKNSVCLIDMEVFKKYLSWQSPPSSSEELADSRLLREKDMLERIIDVGKRVEKCPLQFPAIALHSARLIDTQSKLFAWDLTWKDLSTVKEDGLQSRKRMIQEKAIEWISTYSKPLQCKQLLSQESQAEYSDDIDEVEYAFRLDSWSTCNSIYGQVFSKNYIFNNAHKQAEVYQKLILSDSKTDVLEFTQNCEGLLKITPDSFGEKQNYKAFRALIQPVCQQQELKSSNN